MGFDDSKGDSFHIVSNLYYTSSIVLVGEEWQGQSLNIPRSDVFNGAQIWSDAVQTSNRIVCVSREIRTQRATCGFARCLREDGFLQASKIGYS